jgi:hypothetical protein
MITTKKKIHKSHKFTKRFTKRFTRKTIPTSINNSLNNNYNENSRENALSCYLANNDTVKNYAFEIFYFVLSYWKKNYTKKWQSIIGNYFIEKVNKKLIEKIGFTISERDVIFEFMSNDKKNELFEYLQDKFLKVTSVLDNLLTSALELIFYIVNINDKLQKKFINNLNKLFLVNDLTWDNFVEIYNSLSKKYKNMYSVFIYNIIIYGNTDDKYMSLYKKNLVYFDFIRQKIPAEKKYNIHFLKKINKCNKSIVSKLDYSKYKIYDSKNYYEINSKIPYAKIMNEYDLPYLGGPSGSTAMIYINLFDFYNFPENIKNKVLLLCLIIADYIPLWHTLSEILLSCNVELYPYGIENYNLKQDPVEHVTKIIKPYL